VITNELPQSLIFGSVGADVITSRFSCFVSTAKDGLLSSKTSSVIMEGVPPVRFVAKVVWNGRVSRKTRVVLHTALTMALDKFGDQRRTLEEALALACKDLARHRLVDYVVTSTGRRVRYP